MFAPKRRGMYNSAEYVVEQREGVRSEAKASGKQARDLAATVDRMIQRSKKMRQKIKRTDGDHDSSDEDEDHHSARPTTGTTSMGPSPTVPSRSSAVRKSLYLANILTKTNSLSR